MIEPETSVEGVTVVRQDCTCGSDYDSYCPRDGWRGVALPTDGEVVEFEADQRAEIVEVALQRRRRPVRRWR